MTPKNSHLHYENPVFNPLNDFLFLIVGEVRIDVHGGLDVLVSHDRLDHLEVGFVLTKSRAEGIQFFYY